MAATTTMLSVAVAATACGGDSDAAQTESGPLTMWVMGDSSDNFDKLVAPFVEETGIEVNTEAIPWDGVNNKLTTPVASGDGA